MDVNKVIRLPRGPPIENYNGDLNGNANWSGTRTATPNIRRRFSSEGGDFYRTDGPTCSFGQFGGENNNTPKSPAGVFQPTEELLFITHIESSTIFWAQTAEAETATVIDKLSKDLQVYCQNKAVLQNPPILYKIYGGIYDDDNQWYRCSALLQTHSDKKVHQEKVKVHFVDYGNTELISQRKMVCLSRELFSHVPYAQRYCLDGLQDPVDINCQQFTEGVELLRLLTNGKVLAATTKKWRTSIMDACPVELIDNEEGSVGSINNEMRNKRFATPSVATGRVSPQQQPVSPVVKQCKVLPRPTQVGLPPLVPSYADSVKIDSKASQEMLQMKETIKNQQNVINNQRQLSYQLKENHKAEVQVLTQQTNKIEESYKQDQQVMKHQFDEEFSHAITNKFKDLMSRVNALRKVRQESTDEESNTTTPMFEAVNLLKEGKRVNLDGMEELSKVKRTEAELMELQDQIRLCTDKTALPELVDTRDSSRRELDHCITRFLDHVSGLKLDLWKVNLQVAQSSLLIYANSFTSGSNTVDSSLSCMEVIQEYEEYMEKCKRNLQEVRTRCDDGLKKCCDSFKMLFEVLELDDAEEKAIPENLDEILEDLKSIIEEEISITKCSEQMQAVQLKGKVIAVLLAEIAKELEDLKQLRYQLLEHYTTLQAQLKDWLTSKPEVDKVVTTRKTIRILKSKIGHKLIDNEDLKERDDVQVEELKQFEEELSSAYKELHSAFTDEQQLVACLADLSREHFPELLLQHPELGIPTWLATNGLVITGRDLQHYPHRDSKSLDASSSCHVFNTEFCANECLIKEHILRDSSIKELFQNQAVKFHSVHMDRLVQLQALFYSKNNISAFLQVPSYSTVAEWLTSGPTIKEISVVMRDVLEALQALHKVELVHGGVTQEAVMISMEEGIPRGILGHHDFSYELSDRVLLTAKQLAIDTSKSLPPAQFDMLCYGIVLAKIMFPNMASTNDLLLYSEDAELIALMEGLLAKDDIVLLTAEQALNMAFFKADSTGTLTGPEEITEQEPDSDTTSS